MRLYRRNEFRKIEKKFTEEQGLPFIKLLKKGTIKKAIEEEGIHYRKRIFTPAITLWAFLSQILSDNSSCEEVAGRVRAFFTRQDKRLQSISASAYCQARKRLPENLVSKLASNVAEQTTQKVTEERLWKGRRVAIVDGSTVNTADTEENQREYPQVSAQKEGCGFPIIRIAVAFCLATGIAIKVHFAKYSVHERTLFRQLYLDLEPGAVILGDRGCCSYYDAAWLMSACNHDFVFRLKGTTNVQCRNANYTIECEDIDTWHRPYKKPDWITSADNIPRSIDVRVIFYRVDTPGFRSKHFTIVTSLLDMEAYTFGDIAQLYFLRWHAELHLRTLKTNMSMEMLKGKTPDIVRKEIYAYILAYNLIRSLIFQSAIVHHKIIYSLSYRSSQYSIRSFIGQMRSANYSMNNFLYHALISDLAFQLLPIRTTLRVEPRRIKRRMKRFTLLTQHRNYYRSLIIQGINTERR